MIARQSHEATVCGFIRPEIKTVASEYDAERATERVPGSLVKYEDHTSGRFIYLANVDGKKPCRVYPSHWCRNTGVETYTGGV